MEDSINTNYKKKIRKDYQLTRTNSNAPQICYKMERKCRLPNLFYIASIIIMLKLKNDKKINCKLLYLMNTDIKLLHTYSYNEFDNVLGRSVTMVKLVFKYSSIYC